MSRPSILSCAIALLLLAAGACTGGDPWHDGTPLRGAISLSGSEPGGPLLCGYNHELIRRFARGSGRSSAIRLAGRRESVLDSLRSGDLDIVAFPFADSLAADTTLVVMPSDSCGRSGLSCSADHQGKSSLIILVTGKCMDCLHSF